MDDFLRIYLVVHQNETLIPLLMSNVVKHSNKDLSDKYKITFDRAHEMICIDKQETNAYVHIYKLRSELMFWRIFFLTNTCASHLLFYLHE